MMPEIQNLTNRLVSIRLNNGRMVHIPPKSLSHEIDDALVSDNAKVRKLEERHVIAVKRAEKKSRPTKGRAKGKDESTSRDAQKSKKD